MSGNEWFDDLSRMMASNLPRRQALKLILIGVASQLLPFQREASAADECRTERCPQDGNCSRLNRRRCISDNAWVSCLYANTSCLNRTSRNCNLSFGLQVCGGPRPVCKQVDGRNVRCVQCTRDRHCVDQGKVDCCREVCCEACEKCFAGACVKRCPPRGNARNVECCTQPTQAGRRFTRCCRGGCCNPDSGRCVCPTSTVSKVSGNQLELQIRETEVGIGSIVLSDAVNATVEIPRFEEGTIGPVYVTATRIDPAQPASVQLRVSPISSDHCAETIVPTLTQLLISEGMSVETRTFERIPRNQNLVLIQNGQRGVRRVRLQVNGQPATEHWLLEGTAATIDLASRMTEDENVIKVAADGRAGGSALLVIADVPNVGHDTPDMSSALLPGLWEPSTWKPGQDLTWGR